MKRRDLSGTWGVRSLTLVSASLAMISSVLGGCGPSAVASEDSSGGPNAAAPACEAGVRNEKSDIDCSAACNHVLACRESTGDSDLQALTCNDCLGSCLVGVSLGGNDLVEGTEEDQTSWQCAELVVGCSALDHNCDIF